VRLCGIQRSSGDCREVCSAYSRSFSLKASPRWYSGSLAGLRFQPSPQKEVLRRWVLDYSLLGCSDGQPRFGPSMHLRNHSAVALSTDFSIVTDSNSSPRDLSSLSATTSTR